MTATGRPRRRWRITGSPPMSWRRGWGWPSGFATASSRPSSGGTIRACRRERGGEEILSSRLVTLADVVEVFHNAGGTDAAISVARQRRGTHFDPQVVDVFAAEATSLFTGLEASGWDAVIAAEPALEARLTDAEFEAVQPLQRLHGGLSGPGSANLSGHDLTVFGGRLLPDKTWSRSANRRPSHRVTPDAEDEQPSLANQPPGATGRSPQPTPRRPRGHRQRSARSAAPPPRRRRAGGLG